MNCPKCGAAMEAEYPSVIIFKCGLEHNKDPESDYESKQCLRNQLAQRTAERDSLVGDRDYLRTVRDDLHKCINELTAERDETADKLALCEIQYRGLLKEKRDLEAKVAKLQKRLVFADYKREQDEGLKRAMEVVEEFNIADTDLWDQLVAERDALRLAISRSGLDLSPCSGCGETVACLPDGMPYCEACAKKLEGECCESPLPMIQTTKFVCCLRTTATAKRSNASKRTASRRAAADTPKPASCCTCGSR